MSAVPTTSWFDAGSLQSSHFNTSSDASSETMMQSGGHDVDPSTGAPNMMMPQSMDPISFQQKLHPVPQNQQATHASMIHNGNTRNPSPGFQNPAYLVNSVVPLKRPRPLEDSANVSPRQTTGALPASRSQTPQTVSQAQNGQMYQMYANNPNAPQRPMSATTSFVTQIGQAAPNNGTPSPTMQTQGYKTPNSGGIAAGVGGQPPPKRMATQSPSPFSPANQHMYMQQGSPTIEPTANRSATPHGYPVQPQQNPAFNPAYQIPQQRNFSPPVTAQMNSPMNMQQNFPNNHQAQAMYNHMQRQQNKMMPQLAQIQATPSTNSGGQQQGTSLRTTQVAAMPGSHANPNPNARQMGRGVPNPDQFIKSLQDFMIKRGTPLTSTQPQVADRSIPLFALYWQVARYGGSRSVGANNQWPVIAQGFHLSPETHPGVVEQLAQTFNSYLGPFEEAYTRSMHDRKASQTQQNPMGAVAQNNSTPSKQQMMPNQNSSFKASPQDPPMSNYPSNSSNSYQTPTAPLQHNLTGGKPFPIISSQQPFQPQVQNGTPSLNQPLTSNKAALHTTGQTSYPPVPDMLQTVGTPVREKHDSNFKPKVRGLDTHGGVDVAVLSGIGTEIVHLRPTVPAFNELGIIDVHALTMSLKSGLQAEIRLALDTLVTVSVESQWSLSLKSCEDLVETLVDAAESEVSLLKENIEKEDIEFAFPAYEEVLRGCRQEANTLLTVPRVGIESYDLDRAADRLIAITTIFRNLSFFESNHDPLAESSVIKFVASIIDIMCSTKMLLRSHNNTLDFMKDMIIFLSNLSQSIILPSKDEAAALLRFILAFAPQPGPYSSGRILPMFASYQPSIHRYLPPAVDSLAKLLVRDEPNRAYMKELFFSEAHIDRPWDLLTRSFGLAISPIPVADNVRSMPQAVEARKPYLEQGMLAAEILSGIAVKEDCNLALSWLSSEDGFSHSLVRLVYLLGTQQQPPMRPMVGRGMPYADDGQPFSRIISRGAMVLRNLSMSSGDELDGMLGSLESINLSDGDADGLRNTFLAGMASKKEILLGALMNQTIDAKALSDMCIFTGFDGRDDGDD